MKKLLLTICNFMLFGCLLVAQNTPLVDRKSTSSVQSLSKEDFDMFSKGKWNNDICQDILNFSSKTIKSNDVKTGTQSQFAIDANSNYFFTNHAAIGVELISSINVIKNVNGSKSTNSNWLGYVDFTYGIPLSGSVGLYGQGAVGFGKDKDKYVPNTGQSSTNTSDLFGYKVIVAMPVELDSMSTNFFTPQVFFVSTRNKFDISTETRTGFGLGFKFESSLFCGQMRCDSKNGYTVSRNSYLPNNSFFGANTSGIFTSGNIESKYNNSPSQKEKFTQLDISAEYMYYAVRNFAVGLDIDVANNSFKSNNYKQTFSSFSAQPTIELNIPSKTPAINDFFIRGAYGFGSQRTEVNNNPTIKYSTTDLCFGLGHNFFFHKGLSFTPMVEYDVTTVKNKDTEVKTKYGGYELSVGIRKFLY